MSFQTDFAATCFEKIVQHEDACVAREFIKKRQEEGSNVKECLSKFTKFTAGDYAKEGTNRLGKETLDLMRETMIERQNIEEEHLESIVQEWRKMLTNAFEFLQKQKEESKWTVNDYEVALKSLRRDNSEKTPKRKNELVELC